MKTIEITNLQANYIFRAIVLAHETITASKDGITSEEIDSGCLVIMKAIKDVSNAKLTNKLLGANLIKANRKLMYETYPEAPELFYGFIVDCSIQKVKALGSETASMLLCIAFSIAEKELDLSFVLVD